MLKKLVRPLCLVAVMASGCGDDATDDDVDGGGLSDASTRDGGFDSGRSGDAGDAGPDVLQSGVYNSSNIVRLSDGCLLALEDDGAFPSTQLTNTNNSTLLAIGRRYDATTDPKWEPPGYGLGEGPWMTTRTATLTVTTHATIADDDCEYDITRTSVVTYLDVNRVSVDYTDEESNFNNKCLPSSGYPAGDCTSHYTFELTKAD